MRTLKSLVAAALLLCPGFLAAMVLDGNVISGLPPNSVVELDLGDRGTETATTNDRGEITITDQQDDDDPETLFVPRGERFFANNFPLKLLATGRTLGYIGVSKLDRLSARPATDPEQANRPLDDSPGASANRISSSRIRFLLSAHASRLFFSDIRNNTRDGAAQATASGFDVTDSAEDDAFGWGASIGVALGDGRPLYSQGSHQLRLDLGYTRYADIEGEFVARAPGLTIRSAGKQEIESWDASIGFEYFVADRIGASVDVGYAWYDLEDSGSIVRLEDGLELASFNESRSDDTPTIGVGLSYYPTDNLGVKLTYQYGFDEVGSSEEDKPSNLELLLMLTY